MAKDTTPKFHKIDSAVGYLEIPGHTDKRITVIGTEAIRETFDPVCIQQAVNTRLCPGVTDVVLNPDAHAGYGAPVGSVLVSPSHIYPGPVGVDIKCSMSLLQLDLPAEEIRDKRTRCALIGAICERIPFGPGGSQRSVKKGRHISLEAGKRAAVEGASAAVCESFGIPPHWARRCEDAFHTGHAGTRESLAERLEWLIAANTFKRVEEKFEQLGSYGGGNHFGEANRVEVEDSPRAKKAADKFGLRDGSIAFLTHCGSRGFGYQLARGQFQKLEEKFRAKDLPFPGGDKELVYARLDTRDAELYLDDMSLGANFATVNHLLINALVLESFQQVLPGVQGDLVYFISHNIARKEQLRGREFWVHRKGATRAFPAKHPGLAGTEFYDTGHPILLPGNPLAGSSIMVADEGAGKSCFSVNHGAGRVMGRRAAKRALDQKAIDAAFLNADVLSNCRFYPIDEAPAAYKDFNEVLRSVTLAGLASEVARLRACFVLKDAETAFGGAA